MQLKYNNAACISFFNVLGENWTLWGSGCKAPFHFSALFSSCKRLIPTLLSFFLSPLKCPHHHCCSFLLSLAYLQLSVLCLGAVYHLAVLSSPSLRGSPLPFCEDKEASTSERASSTNYSKEVRVSQEASTLKMVPLFLLFLSSRTLFFFFSIVTSSSKIYGGALPLSFFSTPYKTLYSRLLHTAKSSYMFSYTH